MKQTRTRLATAVGIAVIASGCGSSDPVEPTEVVLGETTFVVTVNPPVNDVHEPDVPQPGAEREDVDVASPNVQANTESDGVAVLAGVEPGNVDLWIEGFAIEGELTEPIESGQLVEMAVAVDGDGAEVMARNDYDLAGDVVVIGAEEPVDRVQDALREDGQIVLLEDGTYTFEGGDGTLEFRGHGLTLFGAGPRGGRVTIEGNVAIHGGENRIRGADIRGDLTIPSNTAAVAFSTVEGGTEVTGNHAANLANTFCGAFTATGSAVVALGNRGLEPVEAPEHECP